MSYWGKLLGGVAGMVMGGPFGAVMGVAFGHAADQGSLPRFSLGEGSPFSAARLAAAFGRRDQLFALSVVVLSAKLAKCDGPVARSEIDMFKRQFRIPPESAREIGRLFDQARDSSEGYAVHARQLSAAFSDNRGVLEDVLTALFAIARADKPLTVAEHDMLRGIHQAFGLDQLAWDQARGTMARAVPDSEDPYAVLGVTRGTRVDEVRAAWLRLVRENHPDTLAARGVTAEFVARASDKVARINAAWDRVKRERGV